MKSKILFLSRWFPFPVNNGSKIRIYHLILELAKSYTVDLISFYDVQPSDAQIKFLENVCRQVIPVQYKPFRRDRLNTVRGFFSPYPRSVIASHEPEMDRVVSQLIHANQYDVLIASQIDMAPYAWDRQTPVKILEELELTVMYEHYQNESNPVRRLRNGLTWYKLVHFVNQFHRSFQTFTVVSQNEKELIQKVCVSDLPVEVVPNGVDPGIFQGGRIQPVPNTIIYPGSLTYPPNLEAMLYFTREIFPQVLEEIPGMTLEITGAYQDEEVQELISMPGVFLSGQVEDIHSEIAKAWLCVAPIQTGGGTRLKILESMALGTPVISTSKGAEGLDFQAGVDLMIADSPGEFANAILDLARSPERRNQMSRQGRMSAGEKYDWNKIGMGLTDLIDRHLRSSRQGQEKVEAAEPQ